MPAISTRLQFQPTKRMSKNYIKYSQSTPAHSGMRGRKAYCFRSSASLAVRLAISPIERRISSLSLGSSHRSAMRLASASSALMFSSPSGPPWGSANQACKMHEHSLVYLICRAFSGCSFDHYPLTWKWYNRRHKRGENIGWRGSVIHWGAGKHTLLCCYLSNLRSIQPSGNGLLGAD